MVDEEREGGDEARDGREEELRDGREGGEVVVDPEHGGGNVANGSPHAPSVGRDDDHGAEEAALVLLRDDLSEEGDEDYRDSEVVEDGGEEEGEGADDPEEFLLIVCWNAIRDDREAIVVIDYVDDGGGSKYEVADFTNFAELVFQLDEDLRRMRSTRAEGRE